MKKILCLMLFLGTAESILGSVDMGSRSWGMGAADKSRGGKQQRHPTDHAGAAFPSLSDSSSVQPSSSSATTPRQGAWAKSLVPPLDEQLAIAPTALAYRGGAAGGGGARLVRSDLQDGSYGAGGGRAVQAAIGGGAAGSVYVGSTDISRIKREKLYPVSFTGLALLFKYLYLDESSIGVIHGYLSVDAYERSLVNSGKPLLTNAQWEKLAREFERFGLYKQAADCYKKAGNKEESQRLFNLFGDQLQRMILERIDFVDFNENMHERLGLVYNMYEALRAYENANNEHELRHLRERLSKFVGPIYHAADDLKFKNKKQAMQLFSFLCLIKSELIAVSSSSIKSMFKESIQQLAKLCREEKDLVFSIIEKIEANFKYKEASEIYILLGNRSKFLELAKKEHAMHLYQLSTRKRLLDKKKTRASEVSSKEAESEDEGDETAVAEVEMQDPTPAISSKEPESEDEDLPVVEPEMPDRSTLISDMSPWFEEVDENTLAARVFAQPAEYWPVRQKSAAKTIQKTWNKEQEKRRRLALMDMRSKEAKRGALLAIQQGQSPVQRKQAARGSRIDQNKSPLDKPEEPSLLAAAEPEDSSQLPHVVAATLGYVLDDEEDGSHGSGGGAAGGGGTVPGQERHEEGDDE